MADITATPLGAVKAKLSANNLHSNAIILSVVKSKIANFITVNAKGIEDLQDLAGNSYAKVAICFRHT